MRPDSPHPSFFHSLNALRFLLAVCCLAGLVLFIMLGVSSIGTPLTPGETITAGDLTLSLNAEGRITGLYEGDTGGANHRANGRSTPLLSLVVEESPGAPVSTGTDVHYRSQSWRYTTRTAETGETARGSYLFRFSDRIEVTVEVVQKPGYATLEVTAIANPEGKDVRLVLWGPLATDISAHVGETVGVVSDRDFAVGLVGVNARTLGGWPQQYPQTGLEAEAVGDAGQGGACRYDFAVCAALPTTFGSMLQAYTRDYSVERVFKAWSAGGNEGPLPVAPLTGEQARHGQLVGSKVALFGVARGVTAVGDESLRDAMDAAVLDRLGAIGSGEDLPHPMVSKVWGKRAEQANAPHLIFTDLSSANLDSALTLANDLGWQTVYRNTGWGVFDGGGLGVGSDFGGNDAGLRAAAQRAAQRRVGLGSHSRFGAIPGSLAARHVADLLVTHYGVLDGDLSPAATALRLKPYPGATSEELRSAFSATGGVVRIGEELIAYGSVTPAAQGVLALASLQRGHEGTVEAAHADGARAGLLGRPAGQSGYLAGPGLLQDLLAPRLVTRLNQGIRAFTFGSSAHLTRGGYGALAQNLALAQVWSGLADGEDFVLGSATALPWTWHLNTRYDWGMTGADTVTADTDYHRANQVYFRRNYLPPMLGWWRLDSANEWRRALTQAAAFDAGFAWFGSVSEAGRLGAPLRGEIRDWRNAQLAGTFDRQSRFLMQAPAAGVRLDKVQHERGIGPTWRLSDWAASGAAGGRRSNGRYLAPQLRGFPLTNLARDARVTVSGVLDSSYSGALAVDTHTGVGTVAGEPGLSGAGEWAIAGSAPDKWIELAWDSPRELRRIILFDRALPDQNVSAGALTFTHADGATSTLSVSGIAADGAPKVVDFAPKTVRQVRFTLTAVSGTAPGLAEFVALGPNPHYRDGALAAGATVTGVTAGEAARLTDGVIAAGTDAFATLAGNSAALDLGGQYYLNGLTVWHYFGDARTYHDVVFEVADNPGFTNSTIVFNNDTDNSLGLGAGTDAEYPETSAGKQVLFAPLPGRYLRLWSGGNTVNDANHLTEVEVYGTGNGATDVAAGGITSGNAAAIGLGNAIDHDPATLASVGTGAQYLQLDLGREKRVNSLLVLRDNADMRTYRGVVYRLSATADFSADVTTVFNNDNDNLHGLKLGESTDTAYQETANGRYVRFTPVTARYVRLYSAGSNYDNTNRYREVLVGTAQAGAAAPSARQAPATASKSSSGGTLARSVAKSTKAKPTEKSTTPTLSSATVTGNTLTLTYDEALDGTSVPASSAFAVKAGPSGSLAAALADTMPVAVAGRTVILTLAAAVSMTDVVQVSYTAPESGKLQDAVGNAAGNLTNQAVTNETPSADKLITAGDLALQIDSMGVVTGLREGSAAGTDHNVSAQSTTLVSLVVESASTARASTGMSAHYKPTGLTYTAGTAGDGETARGVYTFSFADNISAEVTAVEKAGYATLELTGLANPNGKDVRIVRWGPLTTDITESVGEMVGVVSDRDFAIGMLGVNAKTLGGWPREYQGLSYASVAVGGNPWGSRQRAVRQGHKAARAVITTFGTALHSFTRDFTVERVIETNRIEAARAPKRRTPALTGARADAGRLVGSKVAVFGVSRADAGSGDASFREVLAAQALDRVGVIELGEGLPHPIVGNVWAKRSKKAAAPYLILWDLSTSNLDTAAAWATDIGWGTVYRDTAWGVWTDGSFGSVRSQFGGNASGLQAAIDQAERGHVDLGTHSVFGFIPPSFAGDHPTKLMVTWEADLNANITSNATSLTVRADAGTTGGELRGGISSNDGYLRIGSEIIRYRSRSRRRNNLKLGNLQRSREGTTAAAHSAGAQVGLLKRTSYLGFNNYHAELSLYDDELIPRLVAALNRGIGDFSFDGSEWLSESKYGLLTQNLVMRKIYDDLADNEDFVHDMAMGNPYTWHLNSRYNWGETGDDIRVAHQSYRWGNQVFFKRNLMLRPRMVGWWNIDNANEWRWALGKVSAFDAWFGYFGSAGDASRYNANLRAEIRDWTNAIRAGAFDWPNRFVMQERYDYFRLDKVSYSRALGPTWKLSDWATSGNSGGGRSNSRYIAPQMRGFPLTNLAPDAKVAVSGVLDNSYGGALAVDTSTGASSETNRYLTDTNGSGEWAIASSATDKWIELSWDSARKIRRIILFDREFANQNTSAGTLTFTHADSSTTTQAVTGISSDGSPKIVDFAQKTVTKVRFTLTGTSGTAPGLGEFVVLGPSSHYQSTTLAADGTVTGVTAGQAGRVNDGAIAAGSTAFATLTDNNAVLDLGGQYNIGGLNVWHRLGGASRQYHDVIFEIADNSDFDNATIVFNTDADDSLGRGAGGDAAYAEGSAGKLVQFAPVPGRYVRLWSNGNTVDSGNHLTEVEVYGTGNGTTDVADSGVTSGNNAATNLANVIDHSLDSEMANAGDGAQYVQIDLGAVKTVNSLLVMRDDANARTYKGVVYRLSETANFSSGVTTVFHNDNDNLHDLRLGESTDGEYEETENGRYVRFAPAPARYVRLYSSGSDRDDSNRYREVLVGTEEAGTARPPLPVSIAVTERIVTPTAIAQTAGDTLSGDTFAVGNLIDGVGLSETPTVDNLYSVTSGTSNSHVWVTGSQGRPHYFSNSNNPDPQFRLTLDGPHTLMALVVWGYQGSANEATDFTVEFSTDGGQSYVATETVQTSALLGAAGAAGAGRLEFDETHEANHVRLTITSNARVRGFSTVGGDRVGMSEIRFVATAEPTETASVAAANGSLVVLQNTAGTIDLSALAAGDMLTYAVATQPANGTVSLMGSVATYTPNTDSFGSDSFGYGVTDAESNSDTGTIAVTVNRPPAAQDGTLLTQLGVAAEIDVSLLASDLDDDTLSFRVGRQPDHGTALLRFQTGGNIVYTPEHGYTGADSFTYIAEDGAGGMDTGTITVTVSMPPPPPVTVTIASTATFPTKDAFTVTLTFSKSVTGLEVGEVTVTNGTASNFSGLGTTYTVTVTPAAGYAGAVTVSVAAGAATAVGLGNAAASQTFAVDTKAPALSSATVTGSTLTLTYDEALDGTSVPASSAFAVKAGPSGSLAAALADTMPVAVSGRTVILTLAAAVSMTDVVQVSYTAPGTNPVRDAAENAAENLTDRAVDNETVAAMPTSIVSGDLTIDLDTQGRIIALRSSDSVDYLAAGYTPALLKLIVADSATAVASTAEQLLPSSANRSVSDDELYYLRYDYGIVVNLQIMEFGNYASLELLSIDNPQNKDIRVAMWGPYEVTIGEQVADVVGVAYSRDYAIGIQAANEKTLGGAPYEFTNSSNRSDFDHSANSPDPTQGKGIGGTRVALNKYWLSAARVTTFGSVLQAYSRDYSADRVMKTTLVDSLRGERLVEGITDTSHDLYPHRELAGSKIALFGLPRRGNEAFGLNRRQVFKHEILRVIHDIELREGLPYSTGNGGLWSRFADDSKQKILHYYNNSDKASEVLSAGLDSQYIWKDPAGVFKHNGFEYAPKSGTVAELRQSIETVQGQGVRWGNHILPGFAVLIRPFQDALAPSGAPLESAISTRASDLGTWARTTTVSALTATSNTITITGRNDSFKRLQNTGSSNPRRGYARIGNEIVTYTGGSEVGDNNYQLTGVTRGAYGTTAASYSAGTKIYTLSGNFDYNSFYWGAPAVRDMADAVADSVNDTGMDFISFDGIESYWNNMYGELTANAFYKTVFDNLTSKELSGEASRMTHYNWHFHDRWMWGEKNTQVLRGTFPYQFSNNVMFGRNLLPYHTGGFFGSNNTDKDFEWLGSKIAAMDAGVLVRSSGLDSSERAALKRWIEATESGAFSDVQRARMLPWESAFALDEVSDGRRWRLWSRGMALTYGADNVVSGVTYGNPGRIPEKTNPFYVARPWAGFSARNVAGDALVTTSSKRDAGFQGDNAVDGLIGYYKPEHYQGDGEVSEWHTASDDTERWIKLTWDGSQRIRAVLLADRSHPDNNVTGYLLEFSSGSSVSGSSLPSRSKYKVHQFVGRDSTFLKVVITGHQGTSPGLGEIVVIADDAEFKGDLTGSAVVESGYSGADSGNLFDGNMNGANHIGLGDGSRSLVIDLEDDRYFVDGLNVWHLYREGSPRDYHDVIYQLSNDASFGSGVTTVFNNDDDDSADQGTGSDPRFKELAEGKPVYFPPVKARYVRLWSSGNTVNSSNHYTEVEVYGMKNLANGKTPTTDGRSDTHSRIASATDSTYASSSLYWHVGKGKKYAQIDVGRSRWMDSLRVWHYFGDKRRYHDVIFQLSNDASFGSGVTTVFNNDLNNSAGLGAGTDGEYDETVTGKIVHFAPVQARYVRLYSNGSTKNSGNHYTEIMVGQGSESRELEGDTRAPELQSAAVYGSTLTLTYNEALDEGSVPARTAYTVKAGPTGSLTTVDLATSDAVAVSGQTVTLTLASAVTPEQTVTVTYTAPATDPVQDALGNAVANLDAQAVANNTVRPTATIASAATFPTKDAFAVTITFSEAVTGFAAADVAVTHGTAAASFTSNTTTAYTIAVTPVADYDGDVTVAVAADAATGDNGVGNAAVSATFAADTRAPGLATATVNGTALTLTYNADLDANSTPAASAYTVKAGPTGSLTTVDLATSNPVAVSGKTVTLALASAVTHGQTVTVSYTAPATNPVRDAVGNNVENLTDRAVDNETAKPLLPMATSIVSGDLTIDLDTQGRITALRSSDNVDYLAADYTPALLKLIVADSATAEASTAEQLLPSSAQRLVSDRELYDMGYDHGIIAHLRVKEFNDYASLELLSIDNPQNKDIRVAMWGPYELTIGEQVADVAGVAYSRDFAIGIQAANEKTLGGAPYEFTNDQKVSSFDYSANASEGSTHRSRNGQNVYWISAARLTGFGSVLQAYSRDYTEDRMAKTVGFATIYGTASERFVGGVEEGHPLYTNSALSGSKIALFGLKRGGNEEGGLNRRQVFKQEILGVIHGIELDESLPYTTGNGGVWSRFADDSKQKILHFSSSNSSNATTAVSAGLDSVYIWKGAAGVFVHNGFEYKPISTYGGSYSLLRTEVQANQALGVRWGNHILPGFANYGRPSRGNPPAFSAAPVDRFISSRPEDLAESTRTTIVSALGSSDTAITIVGQGFGDDDSRVYAQLGRELVAYSGYDETEDGNTRLTGVTRGIYRTTATSHATGTVIRKLADPYGDGSYRSFSWGSNGAADMGRALAESINDTGMDFISLDGIESFTHNQHGLLSMNVFYKTLFDTLDSKELSGEASRISHYNWHFHDRWMWGEQDTQMLQGTFAYQFSNIVMFSRNFLPNHTGGFFGSNNTDKDFEWLGSKIAAMDAGVLVRRRSSGLDSSERAALKRWIEATESGAFSDVQRARMLPWESAFALDEVSDGRRWRLWSRGMALTYGADNVVSGVTYGNPGRIPEKTNPFYVARPWAGFGTRNIAGDALVDTSSERDSSFQGDNVVDGFVGYYKPEHYQGDGEVSEWHTASDDTERWIKLTWDGSQRIRAVLLADRSDPDNNVTGYRLEFSSGSSVSGSSLPSRSKYKEHQFVGRDSTFLKVVITGHQGTSPGLGEIVVIADDAEFKGDLTGSAVVESGYSGADSGNLFDGNMNGANHIGLGDGSRSLVIDLEDDRYFVDGLNIWHLYREGSPRDYHDVIYQLSNDASFGSGVTTVFNNDDDDSADQGTGSDPRFRELAEGKPVYFPPVKARYVRLWSSGNTVNSSNHYTEVEVYGMKNLANGKTPTTDGQSDTSSGIARATDSTYASSGSYWAVGDGKKYAQIDVGRSRWMDSLRVWHYFGDKRRYHDVIFQLSNDASFGSGVTTVFNNDLNNSAGLGAGTDGEYDETVTGKIVHFAPVQARYVRLYSNGNTENSGNHYTEIMVGQGSESRELEGDTRAPELQSAAVYGSTLTLTYNEALDGTSVPASSAFAVKAGPSGSLVAAPLAAGNAVAVAGSSVILTLAAAVSMTDVVQVSYTAPDTNPIRDEAGNAAGNLTNQAVTNETAGALTLRVAAVAGDDTVNIAEKAAGFSIGRRVADRHRDRGGGGGGGGGRAGNRAAGGVNGQPRRQVGGRVAVDVGAARRGRGGDGLAHLE